MFIVKIKSLRKNPNAGNCVYYQVLGPVKYVIQTQEPIQNRPEQLYFVSVRHARDYEYITLNSDIAQSVFNEFHTSCKFIRLTRKQDIQPLYTLSPEGPYLIEYDDCIVQCEDCQSEFSYHNLGDASDYDYGLMEDICPKCNTVDCCQWRHETPEEFLERTECKDILT